LFFGLFLRNASEQGKMARPTRESSNRFFADLASWSPYLQKIGVPGVLKTA